MRSAADDVRVEAASESELILLRALDGTYSMAELEARFGSREVGETIAQMRELDLVEDAADDEQIPHRDRVRFDRQLRYFSDLSQDGGVTPSQSQARLRAARVAVLGVGGLGGRAALELACCGVGELWLIDGDRVEMSNLNRQIQYSEADIGRPKAEVTAARLRAFDSNLRVRTVPRRIQGEDELRELIAGADLVVESADWPAFEIDAWCNAACFASGIPYIAMAQYPPKVRIGPLYVPGATGCHECQRIAWRREYALFESTVEQLRAQPSPAATLGPSSGLIGAQVGMDAMHFLTGLARPASFGTACMFDLLTMEVERVEVTPEPECPICSHLQPGRYR